MLVVVLSTITNKKQQWIERKRGDETWICGKGLIVFVIVMLRCGVHGGSTRLCGAYSSTYM